MTNRFGRRRFTAALAAPFLSGSKQMLGQTSAAASVMSPAERKGGSARMKRYWARKRKQGQPPNAQAYRLSVTAFLPARII